MKPSLDWLLDVPSSDDKTSDDYPYLLMIIQVRTDEFSVGYIPNTDWTSGDYPCPVNYCHHMFVLDRH